MDETRSLSNLVSHILIKWLGSRRLPPMLQKNLVERGGVVACFFRKKFTKNTSKISLLICHCWTLRILSTIAAGHRSYY